MSHRERFGDGEIVLNCPVCGADLSDRPDRCQGCGELVRFRIESAFYRLGDGKVEEGLLVYSRY